MLVRIEMEMDGKVLVGFLDWGMKGLALCWGCSRGRKGLWMGEAEEELFSDYCLPDMAEGPERYT